MVERWLISYSVMIVVLAFASWAICAARDQDPQTRVIRPKIVYVKNRAYVVRFEDLLSFIDKSKHPIGHGERIFADNPVLNYSAPAIFVYAFFANLPVDPATGFLLVICNRKSVV